MVPLIDMFFLLLVFFIFGVFSMTMQKGMLVELPAASTVASTKEEAVTISVGADGALFLNQHLVTQEALAAALRSERLRAPSRLVILSADRQARHGLVVEVLDAIRQADLSRVSIQAESKPRED